MSNLTLQQESETIRSYDFWKQVNEFRAQEGGRFRHDDFLARVVDECDDLGVCETFAHPQNNQPVRFYMLNKDQMLLVGMRESKVVRKKVLEWLKTLSQPKPQTPALPQNYLEALEQLVVKEKQLIEQAPKVEYFEKVIATTNGFTATEIASELNMSAVKLNRALKEMNVQRKIGGRWVLTAGNLGNGYTKERTHIDESGSSRHSMMWTEKGRMFVRDLFNS